MNKIDFQNRLLCLLYATIFGLLVGSGIYDHFPQSTLWWSSVTWIATLIAWYLLRNLLKRSYEQSTLSPEYIKSVTMPTNFEIIFFGFALVSVIVTIAEP